MLDAEHNTQSADWIAQSLVVAIAAEENGTTIHELEVRTGLRTDVLRRAINALLGRLILSRSQAGVLHLHADKRRPRGVDWEEFAALYADKRLRDEDPLAWVNDNPEQKPGKFQIMWREWVGFLEGFAGHARPSVQELDAFNGGVLARIIFDERHTTVTRVWEAVAARGDRWSTAVEIARAVWPNPGQYEFTEADRYLTWLTGVGRLVERRMRVRRQQHEYFYRRIAPSKRPR